jgi:hypothetical protein
MNRRLRERERSNATDAEKDRDAKSQTRSPMARFRSLARRLVNVPRAELDEERLRDKEAPKSTKRRSAISD